LMIDHEKKMYDAQALMLAVNYKFLTEF
jgi:hypothetical protein